MSTTGSYDFFAEEASKRVDSCRRSTNFFVDRPETVGGSVAVIGELPRRRVWLRKVTVTVKHMQRVAERGVSPVPGPRPVVPDGRRSRWTEHRRARREELVA